LGNTKERVTKRLWLCFMIMTLFFSLWVFWAAAAEPFDVRVFGNFERMSQTNDTRGVVKLREIPTLSGSYGLGALESLRGEILLWDGKLLVSRGHSEKGTIESPVPADEAAFFVEARVDAWDEVAIPNDMTQGEFESFVLETARSRGLSTDRSFPLAVKGGFHRVLWHVVIGAVAAQKDHRGQEGRTHPQGHATHRVFDQTDVTGLLFGFYSGVALEGVISHPGERFHVHYADAGFSVSGHVDDYRVKGGAVLLLPRR
jgi:alpha-acetolactate decarboxylase